MAWHSAYSRRVLAPDYRFAVENLRHHFVDAMTAHLDEVLRLGGHGDAMLGAGRELRATLVGLHEEPPPPYVEDVPDLYFAMQRVLEAKHGDAVGLIRLGLSRNDLDMTVYKMHGRTLLSRLGAALVELRGLLLDKAGAHLGTVLIAHTHHRPGQPTTVAHYLGAAQDLLARDTGRLLQAYDRANLCPLGAAALAGTSHPLDRQRTSAALGFDGPVDNTYDAVASADWEFDLAMVGQSVALNLGRVVDDLLTWASQDLFVLPDGLVQGSSIMPQKRNPVALEHVRTRLSRAIGSAAMVTFSSHNIPFTDLNDFGPDIQGGLVAQHRQLMGGLDLMSACVSGGDFDTARLAEAARQTDTTATELADVLVRDAGLDFPRAHRVVAALLRRLQAEGRPLAEATPDDLVTAGGPSLTTEALRGAVDPQAFVERRAGYGMPAPESMAENLERARSRLESDTEALGARVGAVERAIVALRGAATAGVPAGA